MREREGGRKGGRVGGREEGGMEIITILTQFYFPI